MTRSGLVGCGPRESGCAFSPPWCAELLSADTIRGAGQEYGELLLPTAMGDGFTRASRCVPRFFFGDTYELCNGVRFAVPHARAVSDTPIENDFPYCELCDVFTQF
ncbi:alpha/beta-Hydrolases superfamily protein [Zea mays]|uniref:Alpha/beta-Hydrolases superfamily protein n=1 Tax=Zea mays TaxID=4577 RepID=A0A1D6L2B5_MAIZE|nr:alpha/beta-Hydrolases superfamily protein [Zea mays]